MLKVSKITITHFKNYALSTFEFNKNVIGICGLNGKGKTNLLDAIYYCCFTKSYFSNTDQLNVQFEKDGFRIEALFSNNNTEQKVICINRGGNKKEFSLNGVPYEKFSRHIGLLPVVIVAPDDVELITGSSEQRRRFMDTVLSQVDPDYLQELITYNKVLQQRNALLRKFPENENGASQLLQIFNTQLAGPGKIIFEKRKAFLEKMIPLVQQFYVQIAGNSEVVSLRYDSQLHDTDFMQLLQQSQAKDILLQRSNAGIHKDDIELRLDEQVFKHIASQGQRKSLLFALKIAEYEIIKSSKGFSPLLLLDDVFEKLDDTRMQNLLHWVCNENEGQVFITDTHYDRLEDAFAKLSIDGQIIAL